MRLTRLTLFLIFFSVSVFGQTTGSCRKSTEGKDFWFGFMESRNYHASTHYTEITLTSIHNCNYRIYIGKSLIPFTLPSPLDGTVLPNIPVKIKIAWNLVEATGSETIQDRAIHLVSDQPLNVYALNFDNSSADVAVIYPAESLGNEYYAMCYTPHVNGNGINTGNGRNSEFLIVATQDSTEVWITPSKLTDKLKPANIPFKIWLSKGEVYQVQSENLPNSGAQGQGDLTGSYITSKKPIAFFSGSLATTIPFTSTSAWDHLYEQIPPLQTWGRKFIAVPLQSRHEDTYRVLAAENNTTIRIGSKPPVSLNKGEFYEFMLLYTEPSLIESDKPVLLAQYSNSNSVDRTYNGGDGDPFMVIVSPVNQTREKVAFVAYDSQNITNKYFINVVVKDDAVGKIKLDNNIIIFTSLSGTGYSYAQVNLVTKGNHLIETTEEGKGFIAYVYGFGGVESYGYGVGFNLDIVLDLGSNINAIGKLLVRCDGADPLTLNAGNAFDNYLWSTGDTISAIQVTEAGWYSVTASLNGGCELSDSVELQISKPSVDLGTDTIICNPDTIVLDAGDQFLSYQWSTPLNSLTGQTITATETGNYAVEAINKYGCKTSDTIKVTFKDRPKFDMTRLDTLMCGKYTTTLDISADKPLSWLLESPDAKVNISNLTASVLPADFGTYPVTLTAKDEFSCSTDTSFNLGFFAAPIVDLGRDSTICNPEAIVLNAGNQFPVHLWSTTEITPSVVVKKDGIFSVNIIDKNGCRTGDTIAIAFTDKPKLDLSKLDTLMCGKYTTTLDISADKAVTWLLESPYAKVNISNLTASVLPADFGTYLVNLTAKDEFSCSTDTSFNLGFFAAPIVDLGRDSTICNPEAIVLNAGNQFPVHLWSTTEITPSVVVKKDGIYLVNIIDKNGCRTGDTIAIAFTDKPKLDLSKLDTLMCGKYTTTLNISADKAVTWLLESPDAKVNISNLTASVLPADFGTYLVNLTAKDEFSCVTDTSVRLGFYKTPAVDFTIDAKKCSGYNLNVSYVGDADTVVSNFNWVFGGEVVANETGLNSLVVPLGINRSQRDLSLTVTQDGCPNSYTQKDIKVIPKLEMGVVDNLGCEPFNAEFRAENTEVVVYDWDYGDGTPLERRDKNPFHIYQNDGFYNVKLKITTIVSSGEGCVNEVEIDSLVYVAPIPTVGFTSLSAECLEKGDHQIFYNGTADSLDRYNWDLSELDLAEIVQNPDTTRGPLIFNLKNKPQALIRLNAVSKYGCFSDTAKMLVKRIPDFSISASSNAGCPPFGPLLTAKANDPVDQLNYSWDFGDGSAGTGDQVSHFYAAPDQKYDVALIAQSSTTGCSDTISRKEFMWTYPIPTAGFTSFLTECLLKGDNSISYAGTGDTLDRYIWDLSKFDTSEIIKNPLETQGPFIFNLQNKPQTNIRLSVTSKFGCLSDTATVLVKRVPDFSVLTSMAAGCTPFEPLFSAITGDPVDKVNYSWDFGDGTGGTGDQVTHEYAEPDHKYDVTLFALSSSTGCSDTLLSQALAWAYPKPEAAFSMDNTTVYNDKPTVNFLNSSSGAVSYLWDFGDESTSDEKDPSHYFIATGYKTVLLETFNEFMCSDTVSHQLLVAFDRIFPPTGFSPNAPNTVDREFRLGSEGIATEGYHLTILSRWNDIVFEARDEIKGWNGQMPNGSFAPAGVYVWILNFNDFLGRKHRQTGTVTVVY